MKRIIVYYIRRTSNVYRALYTWEFSPTSNIYDENTCVCHMCVFFVFLSHVYVSRVCVFFVFLSHLCITRVCSLRVSLTFMYHACVFSSSFSHDYAFHIKAFYNHKQRSAFVQTFRYYCGIGWEQRKTFTRYLHILNTNYLVPCIKTHVYRTLSTS